MNPKARNSLLLGVSVLVFACVAFTMAMVIGVATPRVLATIFVLVALIAGLLFVRALKQEQNSDSRVSPVPTAEERRRLNQQIRSSKVFIGFLLTVLAFGCVQLQHAPLAPMIVGITVNLGWVAALILRIRQLRRRLALL